jgi:hypothetical protein
MDCIRIAVITPEEGEIYISPESQERCGFVQTKLFRANHREIYAIGEEKGGAVFGHASTVCALDGSPWGLYTSVHQPKGWINKFRFRTGRRFVVVQASAKELKIQKHCLRRKSSGVYKLTTTDLLADVCLQTLAAGRGGAVCEKYAAAIAACMARLGSRDCQRVFYHKGDE